MCLSYHLHYLLPTRPSWQEYLRHKTYLHLDAIIFRIHVDVDIDRKLHDDALLLIVKGKPGENIFIFHILSF